MNMTQKQWLDMVKGDRSQNSIARELDKGAGNFSTALRNDALSAEEIITISYSVGADPIEALQLLGKLKTDSEVRTDPETVANRIRQDLDALERLATSRVEHDAMIYEFPVRDDPYDDHMPEDAAAFGGKIWGDPDDDNDH